MLNSLHNSPLIQHLTLDNTTNSSDGRQDKDALRGKHIEIRPLHTDDDTARFNALCGKFHYMGEGRRTTPCEWRWSAAESGSPCCSAAYRLKDRDEFIGWNNAQRAARQKLVVQNRRFAILAEPGGQPNLASRVLGLAIRELPGLWRERFDYEPLLAETFCDIEARAGTCYKASGWTPRGLTKGYSRHRADFYIPNDAPRSSGSAYCARRQPPSCAPRSCRPNALRGKGVSGKGVRKRCQSYLLTQKRCQKRCQEKVSVLSFNPLFQLKQFTLLGFLNCFDERG